jgi:hypothetical protein
VTLPLHDHILTRLTSTGADQHPWSLLILAALEGPQALADYLGGSRAITPPAKPRGKAKTKPADTSALEPPGVYLGAITVSGFRGIGPATTLPLHPGPGLTLVVGRKRLRQVELRRRRRGAAHRHQPALGRAHQGVEAGLAQPASG